MRGWTKKEAKRVRDLIDLLAACVEGGQSGIARELELQDRRVVGNWRSRGRIPMDQHGAFIGLFSQRVPDCAAPTPEMLHPTVRAVSAMKARVPAQVQERANG